MNRFVCEYYQTAAGNMPVWEFIENLDQRSRLNFFAAVELLNTFGPFLKRPHAAPLRDGIFELRFKGNHGQVRVLYFFFAGGKAILTHGLVKKVSAVPAHDVDLVIKRRKDYLERNGK